MSNGRARSLDPILQEVRVEREAQAKHFESLDAKAGVVLAFAGAVVALSPPGNLFVDLGRFAASVSGLSALWAFWPRSHGDIDVRGLRDLYLGSEPEFTKLRLLDTEVSLVVALVGVLKLKAQRLKAAMLALGGAALLTAVGLAMG